MGIVRCSLHPAFLRLPVSSKAGAWLLTALWIVPSIRAAVAAPIPVDVDVLYEVSAGQTVTVDLPREEERGFRVDVEERGVDVVVTLIAADTKLEALDGDILRYGRHRIAASAAQASGAKLQIVGNRIGSPPGTIAVRVHPVAPDSAAEVDEFALDLLETEFVQRVKHPTDDSASAGANVDTARALLAGRKRLGDVRNAGRAVFFLAGALVTGGRRSEAIDVLTDGLPLFHELGDKHSEASALNNIAMNHFRLGDGRLARPDLRKALALANATNDPLLAALVQNNLCLTQAMRMDARIARNCFEDVLAASIASGDGARIAVARNNLGGAFSEMGDTQAAAREFEASIALRKRMGDDAGAGDALNNLALERQTQGRFGEAAGLLDRAQHAYDLAHDARGRALALRHRGQLALLLGQPERAVALMSDALAEQRVLGRRDDIVQTLTRLAEAQSAAGHHAAAKASTSDVAALASADGNPHLLADSMLRVARVLCAAGDFPAALEAARQSQAAAEQVRDRWRGAMAATEVARAQLALGSLDDASKSIARILGDRGPREGTLQTSESFVVAADIAARRGEVPAAERYYEQAQKQIERARTFVFDPELRATFLATRSRAYEGEIDLLLGDRAGSPSPERVARAFAVSERLRARTLLDQMLETRSDQSPRSGDAERASLIARLSALAMAKWRLQNRSREPASWAAIEREIQSVDGQLRSAEARIAAANGVANAQSLGEIDSARVRSALPNDVALVSFLTTDAATYAWVISPAGDSFRRLPGRSAMTRVVDATLAAIGVTDSRQPADAAGDPFAACRMLWEPVEPLLATQRVVLVPGEALSRLPFAALRCPGRQGQYLIERFELAFASSASILIEHAQFASRPATATSLFRALVVSDPRYALEPGGNADTRTAGPDLPALPASREEAHAVVDILGPDNTTLLMGGSATAAGVAAALKRPRSIVHFATHGLADASGIDGSGLVLATFDEEGHPSDGFLSVRQIIDMQVPARLVVLSVCDSASGRPAGDQGALSAAYAFTAAGAANVVATRWAVSDRAVVPLMRDFYETLMREHSDVASALASAQRNAIAHRERRMGVRNWASYMAFADFRPVSDVAVSADGTAAGQRTPVVR